MIFLSFTVNHLNRPVRSVRVCYYVHVNPHYFAVESFFSQSTLFAFDLQ